MRNVHCLICGSLIEQRFNSCSFGCGEYEQYGGRPKLYCSFHCRNFQKYFVALQKELSQIVLDDAHKRKIKGDLFALANSLVLSSSGNNGTKITGNNKKGK